MNARAAQIAMKAALMRFATLSPAERAELVDVMVDRIVAELVRQYVADPELERQFGTLAAFLSQCREELADQMERARGAIPRLQ